MVDRSLRPNATPRDTLRCLNTILFEFYRFTPARASKLYHPDSSCLSKVLDKRMGESRMQGVDEY